MTTSSKLHLSLRNPPGGGFKEFKLSWWTSHFTQHTKRKRKSFVAARISITFVFTSQHDLDSCVWMWMYTDWKRLRLPINTGTRCRRGTFKMFAKTRTKKIFFSSLLTKENTQKTKKKYLREKKQEKSLGRDVIQRAYVCKHHHHHRPLRGS